MSKWLRKKQSFCINQMRVKEMEGVLVELGPCWENSLKSEKEHPQSLRRMNLKTNYFGKKLFVKEWVPRNVYNFLIKNCEYLVLFLFFRSVLKRKGAILWFLMCFEQKEISIWVKLNLQFCIFVNRIPSIRSVFCQEKRVFPKIPNWHGPKWAYL